MIAAQIGLAVHFSNACSTIAAVGKALHIAVYTEEERDALLLEMAAARAALESLSSFIALVRESEAAALRLRLENE